jgi:hypothetical protein
MELAMETRPINVPLIRQPSALVPLAMSLAALALVVGHALVYGIVHEADEGAAAHIFQILMAGQLPILAYFTFKWLPSRPIQVLQVLALQAGAWIAAWASVYFLT